MILIDYAYGLYKVSIARKIKTIKISINQCMLSGIDYGNYFNLNSSIIFATFSNLMLVIAQNSQIVAEIFLISCRFLNA